MTPEGKIKLKVKKVLQKYPHLTWSHWPVQMGYGEPTLDCIGVIAGDAFAIETKAPGKRPTPRQWGTIERMRAAGMAVFIVDSDETLQELDTWLHDRAIFAAREQNLQHELYQSLMLPADD